MSYILDDAEHDTLRTRFGYVRGSLSSRYLATLVYVLHQPRATEYHVPLPLPSWGECVLWLNAQAQSENFRQKWNRLANRYYHFMRQIIFVRITERGGLSPTPTVTWNWRDNPIARRRALCKSKKAKARKCCHTKSSKKNQCSHLNPVNPDKKTLCRNA